MSSTGSAAEFCSYFSSREKEEKKIELCIERVHLLLNTPALPGPSPVAAVLKYF